MSQTQEIVGQVQLQPQTLQPSQNFQQQKIATSTVATSVSSPTLQHQPPVVVAKPPLTPTSVSQSQPAIEEATSASSITVGPDQQQVFYSGKLYWTTKFIIPLSCSIVTHNEHETMY